MKTVRNQIIFAIIAGISISSMSVQALSVLPFGGTFAGIYLAKKIHDTDKHPATKYEAETLKNRIIYWLHLLAGGLVGFYAGNAATQLFILLNTKSTIEPKGPRQESWYEFLGVQPNASLAEIKKVYKTKALHLHPDKQQDKTEQEKKDAETQFKKLAGIYKRLSNSNHRAIYDQRCQKGYSDPYNINVYKEKNQFEKK